MWDVLLVALYFLHKVHKRAPELLRGASPCFAGKGVIWLLRVKDRSVFPWSGGYSTFFWKHPHLVASPTPWGPVKCKFPSALGPPGCRFLRQAQLQMLWAQIPKFQKGVYTPWAPAPRPASPQSGSDGSQGPFEVLPSVCSDYLGFPAGGLFC